MAANPDRLRHVFATFLGIPPDSDTPPVCGATLTSAYNGAGRPNCPACDRILRDHHARLEARNHGISKA